MSPPPVAQVVLFHRSHFTFRGIGLSRPLPRFLLFSFLLFPPFFFFFTLFCWSVLSRVVFLLQVLVSGSTQALEYESVAVDPGHAILPDSTLSPNGDYLYALSTSKVSTVSAKFRAWASNHARTATIFFRSAEKRIEF